MNRIFVRILTTLLLVVVVSNLVEAQTMHVTLFVNENEQTKPPENKDRRPDRRADVNSMYEFFQTIANTIGYRYSCTKNSDNLFTSAQVMNEMHRLQQPGVVGPNDIVVFYYGGHGYNDLSSKWPSMNFLDKGLRQTDVKKELDKLPNKPKLVLCIADCCNAISSPRTTFRTNSLPIGSDPVAIKKLFTGFTGKVSIMASPCEQGQFSYSLTSGPILGSLFGIYLRKVVYGVDMYSDWNSVLEKAKLTTKNSTMAEQIPQFEVKSEIPSSPVNNASRLYYEGVAFYEEGDYANAVSRFRQAADQGHASAQCFLGFCYFEGQGVAQSNCEAEKLWRKAAEQGDSHGEYLLGSCYKDGLCVFVNYDKAVDLFHKSASKNHDMAWHELGRCYFNGEGLPRDYDEAKKCFLKAADLGYEASKEFLRNYFNN